MMRVDKRELISHQIWLTMIGSSFAFFLDTVHLSKYSNNTVSFDFPFGDNEYCH